MARRAQLVIPAGDPECLRYALAYGADAVVVSEGAGFDERDLMEGVAYARGWGLQVYVALTAGGAGGTPGAMYRAAHAGADGLVLGEVDLVRTARDYAPGLAIFLSERAGITSPGAASAAAELGVGRIVLPRTLTLEEIAAIRRNTPRTLEFGAYIYGALRLGALPRGLVPARGGEVLVRPQGGEEIRYLLEDGPGGPELTLPGALDATALLDQILDAGVGHLFVESAGRGTVETASIAAACRAALDAALTAPLYVLPAFTRRELDAIAHQPYTQGCYPGRPAAEPLGPCREAGWQPLALVTAEAEGRMGCAAWAGSFRTGEGLEFLVPGLGSLPYAPKNIWDESGHPVRSSDQAGPHFWLSAPSGVRVPAGSLLRRPF